MEIVKGRKPGLLKCKAAPVEALTSFNFENCVFYSLLWSLTPSCGKLNCKYNFEAVFLLTNCNGKKSKWMKTAANLASGTQLAHNT